MVASVGRCYTNPLDYAQENYYTEGESFTNSEWLGLAAEFQGLSGQIKKKDFHNAYSSLDPNGNPLRKQQQYKKSSRRYNRPGTDVTLSAPKSVTVAALVHENQDIKDAHKAAVRATMKYVENNCIFYQTKQRGQKLLLQSKSAQIAVLHHDDNRNKDPQLHSHCVILNQTVCPDKKWRAVANKELYKQQKTIGAYYDHELARQIQQKGYRIEWTSDHTFELAGVDKEKLDAVFSTRSNQIEAELASRGLTRATATAEQKQAACLKTRQEKKRSSHPQDRQKQLLEWQTRAIENGIELNNPTEYHRDRLGRTYNNQNPARSLNELIENATKIMTERDAEFLPHELLRECLRQSQGRYEPKKIQKEIDLYQSRSSKQVVNAIAWGALDSNNINVAYQKLNEQGKIKQIVNNEARIEAIAAAYLSCPLEVRDKTLIIAGTNADKQAIAQKVRACLMAEETLGNQNLEISTLRRKNLDKFAITQARHYQRGDVIKFQTDSARFSKDSYYRVTEADPETKTATLIDTVGLTETLYLDKYKQREVYQLQQLEIRPGERMRFTKNIRNSEYKQLNGQRFTVLGIIDDGHIEINSLGKTQKISPLRLLHSDYSYVDTVHSSQGQTADYCIYSAANAKSKTIGRESFYLAASRAKQEFVVYTKNAVDLGVTIQLSQKSENAHELVQPADSPKPSIEVNKQSLTPPQQTTKTEPEPFHQLNHLNDTELVDSLTRLSQWQKDSPNKPDDHYGQSLDRQIEQFKKEKARLGKRLKLQKLELEKFGNPRSIFNPFGVSADVIEDKQIEIGRTRSEIYNIESQFKYVLSDFQRWHKQARAYLAWDESESTKQMRQLEKSLFEPQIQQRIERLKDVYALFAAASYIVNQQGTESFKGRYYQGKSYRIEQQGKMISISHKNRNELLMQATDCRKTGGIIKASQFNLTNEDKKIICDSARHLKQQIERLHKSRQIDRGGLSY